MARPLDRQDGLGHHKGSLWRAEGRRTLSGAFSGPYVIVRQTDDATDAMQYPL